MTTNLSTKNTKGTKNPHFVCFVFFVDRWFSEQ